MPTNAEPIANLDALAAVDLGSNSFHMLVARVVDNQVHVVDRIKAPLFIYQGAHDPRVPRSEQDQLVTALRKREIPVEYMVAADEGHSLSHKRNKRQFVSRSMRFVEQVLGLPGIAQECRQALLPPAAEAGAPPAQGQ